ncbi:MAG: hypothetical protein ABIT58_02835 [Ferruginibacter sp.]
MKYLIRFSFFVFTYFTLSTACSKKNDNNAPVILPDTLTPGWTKITSLPKVAFRDIFFPDNTTGYAIGDAGIFKSSDGGTNWAKINTANYLVNIGAANANRLCFVGNTPRPYITQDGGNTFDSTAFNAPGGAPGFNDCFFSSLNTCYFSSFQYVWKSVNGGVAIDTVFHFNTATSNTSLFFLNDTMGWILRDEGIYKTLDGGSNWNLIASYSGGPGTIFFVDQDNGYYSGNGAIFKTTTGGTNWTLVFAPAIASYGDVDFVNANEGFCCFGNKIYKTTDAGASWSPVAALGNDRFIEIHFNDAAHGWACTTGGVVLKFNQ